MPTDTITKADIDKLNNNPKLKELVQEIAASSFPVDQYRQWNKIDRAVKAVKDRQKGEGGSLDASQSGQDYLDDINVPLAFLVLDTLVAQIVDVFFDRANVFTYTGVTSDDIPGCQKLTQVVNTGLSKLQSIKELKTAIRNGFKYNQGYTLLTWETLVRNKVSTFEENGTVQRGSVPVKNFSGCKAVSVSPYRMILDRSVPPDRLQKMRWVGHWEVMSKNDILREYNVQLSNTDWRWLFYESGNSTGLAQALSLDSLDNQNHVIAHLYVDIIPSEYGLPGDKPEVWYLVLAGDNVVLRARPVKLPAGKYPYYAVVPDGDGFDLDPVSRISLVLDLIAEFNWLHNSHMYAVRKGLDGDIVVDPAIVDMRTVEDRDPSRKRNVFIVSEQFQGMPGMVREGLFVIPNTNDTDSYTQQGDSILDLVKLISGATDPLIGGTDSPQSRRTAEEIASTKRSASQRLMLVAGNIHDDFMLPLGTDCAVYTQHYLDHDVFVRASADPLEPATSISPDDLLVDYDVAVGDEYLTVDKTGIINSWQTLVQTIFQNPQLIQSFNLVEILAEFGQTMGIKDIRRFISQAGVSQVKSQAVEQNLAQMQPQPPVA